MDHSPLFQAPDPSQATRQAAPEPKSSTPNATHQRPTHAPKAGWLEKRPHGRWRAHIRVDGKRHMRTFTDPDEAVDWLDSMSDA